MDRAPSPGPQAAPEPGPTSPVAELRLAITAEDWAAAVAFYRDALGLPQLADFSSDDGRVALLDAGRATLEILDADQAAHVDDLEVGRRVAPPVRVALRVADADDVARRLGEAGADVVGEPRTTPWGSRNARLDAPVLHLTLFSGGD